MENSESSLLAQLRDVTRVLLDRARPAYSLRSEVMELKSILENASGFRADKSRDISIGETVTQHGTALSPTMAAMCVDDFARTVQLIRGLHDAVKDRSAVTGRCVRVLYAGCGPWATLATPLMTIFAAGDVRYDLIDIHAESVQAARGLFEALGVGGLVGTIEVADASTHQIAVKPDIVLIEMMRSALEIEPQVAASLNLMAQSPDAILIPEEVRIDLALDVPGSGFSFDEKRAIQVRVEVGRALTLNKEMLADESNLLGSISFELPDFDEARFRPSLLTGVTVYREHVLSEYDSGITTPMKVRLKPALQPHDKVEVFYEMGSRPCFRINRIC